MALALARYEWPAFNGAMSIQSDISYSDSYFYNLRNFDTDQFDSYVISNARMAWVNADQQWKLSVMVRNLTDERVGIQGFSLATLCGCNKVSYQAPRWYGAAVKFSF